MPSRRTLLRALAAPPALALLGPPAALALLAPRSVRAAGPQAGFDAGLLWRVTPRGAPTSHLYGTLHLDDDAAKAFAPAVRAALKAARVFMPELRSDADSGQAFAAATQLPAGQTLQALAGEALFAQVAALLAVHYQLPPRAANRLKPWAAYLQLNQPSGPVGESVDAALERLALQQGKPVEPLESVQQQIEALEAIPLAAQLALLEAQAQRHAEAMAALGQLLALYLAQDLAGLDRLQRTGGTASAEARAAQDELLEQLLYRRSERMAERLAPALRQGRAFVAVGALHLHGPRGLPALLARAGHRVERVG